MVNRKNKTRHTQVTVAHQNLNNVRLMLVRLNISIRYRLEINSTSIGHSVLFPKKWHTVFMLLNLCQIRTVLCFMLSCTSIFSFCTSFIHLCEQRRRLLKVK